MFDERHERGAMLKKYESVSVKNQVMDDISDFEEEYEDEGEEI